MSNTDNSATGLKFEQQTDGSWLLYLFKGVSINQSFGLKQNDVAIDITDWEFALTVKTKIESGEEILNLNSDNGGITVATPANGIFTITKDDTSALENKQSGYFALTAVNSAGKTILLRSGKTKTLDQIP